MKHLIRTITLALLLSAASVTHAQYIYAPSFQGGQFNYVPVYSPPAWAAGPLYWSQYGVEAELRGIRWALEDAVIERRRWRLSRLPVRP